MSAAESILLDWTVRVSMLCFAWRLWLWIRRRGVGRVSRTERRVWLTGCLFLLVHILSAFHFRHQWSHTLAVRHTAEQTKSLTGIDWGGGVWINYLMMVWWIADAARVWVAKGARERRALGELITLGFFAFVVFNATVVFGSPWWIAGFAAWAVAAAIAWKAGSPQTPSHSVGGSQN